MSRLVLALRNKPGLDPNADLNAAMGMSNASLAKVQFKIDKERVRHEQEVRHLNKVEQTEMRCAQRELEEVKRELHALNAYKLVAKQTAFKRFDKVELMKRERRRRQKEMAVAALEKQRARDHSNSSTSDEAQDEEVTSHSHEQRRRSSVTGEIYVTLRDIMESDDVLRKNSLEILKQRRKSQMSLDDNDEMEDEEKSRMKKWLTTTTTGKRSLDRRPSIHVEKDLSESSSDTLLPVSDKQRRRSRIGSVGDLVEDVIREDTNAEKEEEKEEKKGDNPELRLLENGEEGGGPTREAKRLVVSGRKGFKTGNPHESFFLTTDGSEIEAARDTETTTSRTFLSVSDSVRSKSEYVRRGSPEHRRKNGEQLRPMTLFEISKMYEKKKAERYEANESRLMNVQRKKAQREYENFRFKLNQKEHRRKEDVSEKLPTELRHIMTKAKQNNGHDATKEIEKSSNIDFLDAGKRHNVNVAIKQGFAVKGVQDVKKKTLEGSVQNAKDGSNSNISTHSLSNELSRTASDLKLNVSKSQQSNFSSWQTSSTSAPTEAANGRNESIQSPNNNDGSPPTPIPAASSAVVRGLARFRNAATAVAIQQRACKGNSPDRMKNVAAAVMIQNKSTKGRMPASFLCGNSFTWTSPRDGSKRNKSMTALEASHKNPDDDKIRPLKIPLGVLAEQEQKWGELMSNVKYAVFWKAKALREDTGTLSTRQMRRQAREKPLPRKALFPNQCKTSWAMKKYVTQELGDVIKSWQPENLRKQRNRKLIEDVKMPQFIDRIRATTFILKSFREFKRQGDNDDDGDGEGDGVKLLDDDDEDEKDEKGVRLHP